MNAFLKHSDLAIVLGIVGTLTVMILPIPSSLMDILLVTNLTVTIAILLVAVYAAKPLDFSVFPTVLLFSTLFRLSLNVASIRLILIHGHEGPSAAGRVIESFGHFVVGGNYIVGTVVFIVLIIINFVVITRGSGRVAEVAARFILDSMPGKQMSIDADLNAGLINENEARERRRKIEVEADFYGAMDGASKFVRGDAIAGILIYLINIIGGLSIGVFQKGLTVSTAVELYTLMTIGDGLVTQIPSLIVSTASGIVVTRASSGSQLSEEVARQMILKPKVVGITGGILLLLALMPSIPAFPFAILSAICFSIYWAVSQRERGDAQKKLYEEQKEKEHNQNDTHVPPSLDVLELQVGYGLIQLVEKENQGDLVDRIYSLRKEFAKDLGIVVPKVRIKDNLELGAHSYSILIRGVPVGGGELMNAHLLAMDPGNVEGEVRGVETKEPVFGLSALWISEKSREKAQMAGYTVVDHSSIIATHLSEIIRKHAAELIGRQELQSLLDHLGKSNPKVVEDVAPSILPLGVTLKVCQNLLKEQVSMRDLVSILECLANHAPQTKDPEILTEYVRHALSRTITSRLTLQSQELEVITLDPKVEEKLISAHQKTEHGSHLNLEPGLFENLITRLQEALDKTVFSSGIPVLLCHPLIRSNLRKLTERFLPSLNIVSANEIASFAKVKAIAKV